MNLFYIMDTLFDLLNESNNLNVRDLATNDAEGIIYVTAEDGTRFMLQCTILP